MAIKKQEFYEGAALHQLACAGRIAGITYEPPFFRINNHLWILLKYCTKARSPWGFTFTPSEQTQIQETAAQHETIIGLVCGSDGVAAFSCASYISIADPRPSAVHIACYRKHGEHYLVSGPDGELSSKVAPSRWRTIISQGSVTGETS